VPTVERPIEPEVIARAGDDALEDLRSTTESARQHFEEEIRNEDIQAAPSLVDFGKKGRVESWMSPDDVVAMLAEVFDLEMLAQIRNRLDDHLAGNGTAKSTAELAEART
jgi:hypothetical protein